MTAKEINACNVNPKDFLENNGYEDLFKTPPRSVFHHAVGYLKGLISLPRGSNMSKISGNVTNCGSNRDLSHFISASPWSHEEVMKLTRSHVIDLLGHGGSIIFDETGQQKYGPDSVCTSHQYLGKTGHTCTAQVGVFASYCMNNLASLIDYRLFIPNSWEKDYDKSIKAKIPLENLEHKTKPELALEMLDTFIQEKIPFGYVQADGLYGNDSKFISGLYEREVSFVCDIPSNTLVYITLPESILPERQGNRGRFPIKLKILNTSPVTVKWLSEIQKTWEPVIIRFTDRGIKTVECAVLLVWRRQNKNYVDKPLGLIMIRDPDEVEDENKIRFAFTNVINANSHDIAKMQANRYWIERNFEDAKGLCDLDSFRGRSWISWHHHIALVILALFFLLQIQQSFKKKKTILSLNQVVSIFRYKNPLRQLSAEELADSINYVNKIREKMWFSRMEKWLKRRYENAIIWTRSLIETRSDLSI